MKNGSLLNAIFTVAVSLIVAANVSVFAGPISNAPVDFNGDTRSDYNVVRLTGGGAGQLTWYTLFNGSGAFAQTDWGLGTDSLTPGDYDGDGKSDIALWRPGVGGVAGFFILNSGNGTFAFIAFGMNDDDPFIVADYTGDGKDDPAIYREGVTSSDQSTFWYLASSGPQAGQPVALAWGLGGDAAVPGDFVGDNAADFCVQRNIGGQAVFFIHQGGAQGGPDVVSYFGLATDTIVPGDYDGDNKTDLAVTRNEGGNLVWYYLASSNGNYVQTQWGTRTTDLEVQGDYDGDGKTDIGVWRRTAPSTFYISLSGGGIAIQQWGLAGDVPAGYDVH